MKKTYYEIEGYMDDGTNVSYRTPVELPENAVFESSEDCRAWLEWQGYDPADFVIRETRLSGFANVLDRDGRVIRTAFAAGGDIRREFREFETGDLQVSDLCMSAQGMRIDHLLLDGDGELHAWAGDPTGDKRAEELLPDEGEWNSIVQEVIESL